MGSGSVPVLPSQGVNLLPSLGGAAMAADETRENSADLMDGHDGLNEPGASSNVCVIHPDREHVVILMLGQM